MSIKISVVMASFLGDYDLAGTDRIRKFHRAIESFLNQTYKNSELIVVADGCHITANELLKYGNDSRIKLIPIQKQQLFSGNVRNTGCFMAMGDYICYLDTDDILGENHLNSIAKAFIENKGLDWVYYDDYVIYGFNPITNDILSKAKRDVELSYGSVGTSSVAHKRLADINWNGCDDYGHDWTFITKLINNKPNYIKIEGCEYDVCHIPNQVDC